MSSGDSPPDTPARAEADRLFLESIVEHIPDMIFVKDAKELRFVRFNRAGERLLGIERHEMYGRNDRDFFPDEQARFFIEKDRQVLAGGEVVDIPEEPIDTPQGRRWLHTRKVPILDPQGRPLFLLGISSDITDFKRSQEALARTQRTLAEREAQLRVLLQQFPGAVWTTDERGLIRSMSGAESQTLTRGRSIELGEPAPEQLPPPHDGESLDELHQRAMAGESTSCELRVDDRVFECRLERLEQGGQIGTIGVALDVTQQRRVEAQRLQAQLREAQRLESLGLLAGGVAHDFNNLLVGMLGSASQALAELPPDSPVRQDLRRVEVAAERAADLTRQMLAYSGRGRFVVEPLDLGQVVQEMTELLRVSTAANARLDLNFADDLPLVEADVAQLRQLVMNLITNASDAIGEDQGRISLTTSAVHADREYLQQHWLNEELPEGGYVVLEVNDTGCGMDEETRQRMFDPFFSTKVTGHGLGLAATLGIVRGHRGTLRVYSEPGQGTCIKILLPASERGPLPAPAADVPGPVLLEGGTVLVVDDEPLILEFAQLVLGRAGFDVRVAEDGDVAVEMFAEDPHAIDVVLLDMTMPRMGGVETFRELRKLRADVRVILSSGYNEQEATSRFTGQGRAGFIQKPYRNTQLVDCIRGAKS